MENFQGSNKAPNFPLYKIKTSKIRFMNLHSCILCFKCNVLEFIARRLRACLNRLTVKPLFIEPGSSWENSYIESFNGKMRDELLNREIFYSLKEAEILIEQWRFEYNTIRPYSALVYRPPAPKAIIEINPQFQPLGLSL
jgi:hypothetical protein